MLSLLVMWVSVMETTAYNTFVGVPDNRHSHSSVLNIHHPGGSKLHSYHRRGPFGSGVSYVHRQGPPALSPLIIHRVSAPSYHHSKFSHQKPRVAEDMEKSENKSANASVPIQPAGSGRAVALSSVLLAPTDYFNTEEMNGASDKMPAETIVYPLAKTIQKHYIPKQQPFYVRLPPEHPLRHIPVAMVVTPPVVPQYFRSSKDDVPLEEKSPSLPTPRPTPQPSVPPSAAPLPPHFFPANNYYTFITAENQTGDHQPSVPALHSPHLFPYNCNAPVPVSSSERAAFSLPSEPLPSNYFPVSNYQPYDPSNLQAQQSNVRSEDNSDSLPRSSEKLPSYYFPNGSYLPYDPSNLPVEQSNARSEENVDSSSPSYYFTTPDSSKPPVHTKSEARTIPHHHFSYHEAGSHIPHFIHEGYGEGIHKHIMVHHSEPYPYIHSDLTPTLHDDLLLAHGGHSTYLHEEPYLHGHLSLNLGRNAPSNDKPKMHEVYTNGYVQLPDNDFGVSPPWVTKHYVPATTHYVLGYPNQYSPMVMYNSRNIHNDVQENKQDLPYLLRRLRSFEGSEHESTSNLGNTASESDKSLTISLPIDMSNTETPTQPQKKEAIYEHDNLDFHPETTKLLDLSQVLSLNEVGKRSILETILSRKALSEKENIQNIVSPDNSDNRSFSQEMSESGASPQAELGNSEPEKAIASLDTFWREMRAKRSKRQTSQMQTNNTSSKNDSGTTASARSHEEERTIGYVIGFLDPQTYNYYFGSENNQNFAGAQNYYQSSDYRHTINDKTGHHVPIPVYYRWGKTDSYTPLNLMAYRETGTSDPRSIKEEVANPNITTKNADGYWTYNKTARYNSFGADTFPNYYNPYPVQHDPYSPELAPVLYHQLAEHLMPHRLMSTYPAKMYNPKAYPVYPYSSDRMQDGSTNGYYADMSGLVQMDARSFSNMNPASEHPIMHHHLPNRYNTHRPGISQANVRPLAHPIRHHQRPGRYYATQKPELHARPYHSYIGANLHPNQHHRPSRYYADLPGYPHKTYTDATSFRNTDDVEESPTSRHYTSRYYEHSSGYPPGDTRFYSDEGYYHPSRYLDPEAPYGGTELIGPHRYYESPYLPDRDLSSYEVNSIHQHPTRYHHLHRLHEHYHPPPSRYHHSRRYYEHVHGSAREAASTDSKTPVTSERPQMRSSEEGNEEDSQQMQADMNLEAIPKHPIYPSRYASGSPYSPVALVSFFTTDKQSPYPTRFNNLGPYRPMYPSYSYMNRNWDDGYNSAAYFSKIAV